MKTNSPIKGRQSGFTMIEIMIVFTLAAIATLLGVALYQAVTGLTETEKEVRNINSLVPLVKQTFMTAQGNYEGLSNTVMLNSRSFPDTMRVNGSNTLIRHSWNPDGIDLDPVNYLGTPNDSFTITYKSVPAQACQDLMVKLYTYFEEVEINGSVVGNVGEVSLRCGNSGDATIVLTTR